MTSRERLLALLRGQPTDRIGNTVRGVRPWDPRWVAARHESFGPLIEAFRREGDWLAPIGMDLGFFISAAPVRLADSVEPSPTNPAIEHRITVVEGPHGPLRQVVAWNREAQLPLTLEHYIKTPADAENFLAMPYVPPWSGIDRFLELDRRIGDRGVVQISFGGDPICFVYDLLGTETLAIWSFEHRELLHRLLAEFLRRQLDLVDAFAASGIAKKMPLLLGYVGPEVVVPPLHPPADFRDFCTRYDQPLGQAMHAAGAFLHVHSHGSISKVLEDFVAMGTDMLHPVEAPPMGDTPLPEAKRRIGSKLVIEGNIQVSDLMDDEPAVFRGKVEQAVAEGKPGGRFCLCPTASPYQVTMSDRATTNYLAMFDVVREMGY